MAPKATNPNIEGHAAQWHDLSPTGRKVTESLMAETGAAPSRAASRLSRGGPKVVRSEQHAKKTGVKLESLRMVTPKLRDAKVTLQTAANRRQGHYEDAVRNEHGDPEGSGWYFDHHARIADAAHSSGYEPSRAITASAVMSPSNSPENERASVTALMDAHAHHSVEMTSKLAGKIRRKGGKVDKSHIGQTVKFSDLHPTAITAMASDGVRQHANTSAPDSVHMLTQINRGGTKVNIHKAIDVLRGGDTSTAIDPHSSPKVWSYHQDIQNAVPNSAEHQEYMSRVGEVASKGTSKWGEHHQGALDLHGLRGSREGILNPAGHTAEDTWMNSITSGQQMKGMPTGRQGRSGTISPAKTYGSEPQLGGLAGKKHGGVSAEPDARVGAPALQHAFNNRATHKAAAQASRGTGVELPAVAMQEVSWTQARRVAGADPDFNNRPAAMSSPQFQSTGARTTQSRAERSSERQRQVKGQQGLF